MKVVSAVFVVAVLLAADVANAQAVHPSKMKCKDFVETPKEVAAALTVWLDGFFTDDDEVSVVDFDELKITAQKLATYCTQNPRMELMTAAETVIDK
jgi:hypothetical protein